MNALLKKKLKKSMAHTHMSNSAELFKFELEKLKKKIKSTHLYDFFSSFPGGSKKCIFQYISAYFCEFLWISVILCTFL